MSTYPKTGAGARRRIARVAVGLAAATLAAGIMMAVSATMASAAPDPAGTIYVADNATNSIDVFAPGANGDVAPIRVISGAATGMNDPGDVKVDAAGDVWVVNAAEFGGTPSVTEYAPGASGNAAPICTISGSNTGFVLPDDMSLAADGTVYVGDNTANAVFVFGPGACGNVTPLRTIAGSSTGFNLVDGVGVDAAGTLYADSTLGHSIQIFAPGANGNVAPTATLAGATTGLSDPDDIVVDFFGNLYVTNGFASGSNSLQVFAAGATGDVAPIQDVRGSNTDFRNPDDLAVDASGNAYVTDANATVGPAVLEFASGATGNVAPTAAIAGPATTLKVPEGVAVALPPPPSLTTTVSSSSIGFGSATHDAALLSGGNSPTGSLEFELFGPGDPTCSAAPAYTSPLTTVSGTGTYSSPSFTPTAEGSYSWVVLYSGDASNAPVSTACGDATETVTVTARAVTVAPVGSISSTEGSPFSGTVATFTDTVSSAPASQFSASIDWGDGQHSAGSIAGGGGSFTVTANHTYTEEGMYLVSITVTDSSTGVSDAGSTTATVADAAIGLTCQTPATSLTSFSGMVAQLTDANPLGTTGDFTTTIGWGDGTIDTVGVTGSQGGPFSVSGTHTFATTGPQTITVTTTDDGGQTATTSCTILTYQFAPGGGAFVIGDDNSAPTTPVTFWGAEWWKLNTLSGGASPAAFKGYALNPTTPTCGTPWSTDPGNSAPPPAGPLPTYMGVIVTSSDSQSGSQISGNTPHIVIVKTNGDYDPNAGHAGTGTVIAQVC